MLCSNQYASRQSKKITENFREQKFSNRHILQICVHYKLYEMSTIQIDHC